MADNRVRLYWDTSCFLCFLNPDEGQRRSVCETLLRGARDGQFLILTSTFTISEVVYLKRSSLPNPRRLTPQEADRISAMFRWPWLKKVDVDQRVAFKAVELSRDFDLLPSDAVQAASAILNEVSALHRWDRDFNRIAHLVAVEDPNLLNMQGTFGLGMFPRIGPAPEDFVQRQ